MFPNEPKVNPRLLEFSRVVILPHMGTMTPGARKEMEIRTLTNLKDYLITGKGKDLVPELRWCE